jgi:MFS transporter, DHA3 family, macrolide efflux protein
LDPEAPLPAAPSGTSPSSAPSFRRALGHRPFFLLWLSQLISQSGDFIFEVALLWLVLETTGSVLDVGLVVTATIAPAVVLGPFLGVYVDRWPRRTILAATNVAEGLLVGGLSGLVLSHAAGLGLLLGIVTALGAAAQAVRIASNALIPQTVGTDDLAPANSLLSFSNSANQIVGLSIGGVAVAVFGVALPIEYDALTFFVAAALVLLIPRAVGRPEPKPVAGASGFRAEFVEGFRFVRSQRFLLELIALGLVVNFFGNAVSALIAPYADFVLHGGPVTYGLLGALVAAGAIAGAVLIGKVNAREHTGAYALAGAVGIGLSIAGFGLTDQIAVALAVAFVFGVFLSVTNVPLAAAVQARIPARLMGRVMAVFFSVIVAAGPFGTYFAGAIASRTGVESFFLYSGIAILLTVAVGSVTLRELRTLHY